MTQNKLRTPWPIKLANIKADSEHRPSGIHAWGCDGAEPVIFTQAEQNGPSISELHCIEQVADFRRLHLKANFGGLTWPVTFQSQSIKQQC